MKLEVGMYVRTKEGNIEKICAIENERIYTNEDYLSWYVSSNSISKASHNIIDLIEEGDYVNDYKVDRVQEVPNKEIGKVVVFDSGNVSGWEYAAEELYKHEIKSIVTKEQFESMQYKVD